jgi:hypothetical protein
VGAHRLAVVVGAALAVPMLAGSTGATPLRSPRRLRTARLGRRSLSWPRGLWICCRTRQCA